MKFKNEYVCEVKFEFKNPRHNTYILAALHLALIEQDFFLKI